MLDKWERVQAAAAAALDQAALITPPSPGPHLRASCSGAVISSQHSMRRSTVAELSTGMGKHGHALDNQFANLMSSLRSSGQPAASAALPVAASTPNLRALGSRERHQQPKAVNNVVDDHAATARKSAASALEAGDSRTRAVNATAESRSSSPFAAARLLDTQNPPGGKAVLVGSDSIATVGGRQQHIKVLRKSSTGCGSCVAAVGEGEGSSGTSSATPTGAIATEDLAALEGTQWSSSAELLTTRTPDQSRMRYTLVSTGAKYICAQLSLTKP